MPEFFVLGTARVFRLREVVPTDETESRKARTFNIPLPHNSVRPCSSRRSRISVLMGNIHTYIYFELRRLWI